MRGVIFAAAMVLASGAIATHAKQPSPKSAAKANYAKAYAMAARCMVFNTYVHDTETARIAFDAWKRLGQLQRLTDAKMSDDMDHAVAYETVQLRHSPDYRAQTLVDCRALGWAR